jgi:hypothetical protein
MGTNESIVLLIGVAVLAFHLGKGSAIKAVSSVAATAPPSDPNAWLGAWAQ